MKRYSTLILLLLFSLLGFTQDRPLEEEGSHRLREEAFNQLRELEDGSLPDLWQAFLESKSHNLNRSGSVPAANWTSLGPNTIEGLGGRITCHAFNPQNPKSILAGAAVGGVWKSTDGGESWSPLTDDLPSIRISAIAYHPKDSSKILLGTGNIIGPSFSLQPGVGVLISTDAGMSWNQTGFAYPLSSGIGVSRIIWDQRNPDNVYLGASNGLWLSRNGGVWWAQKLAGTITDLKIVRKDPSKLYAAVHSTGMFMSTDSADSWTQLTSGLPAQSNTHRVNFALCDSFPDFMMVSVVKPGTFGLAGLYKSSDGGQNWSIVFNPPNFLCRFSCLGWYVNLVAISPSDTNHIILGGDQLKVTTDGGTNWQGRSYYSTPLGTDKTGLAYVDQWDIGYDPQDHATVYVFNDGGVQKSVDDGITWESKNQGLITGMFYRFGSFPGDSNLLVGGTQDHGLQYLDNTAGNIDWKQWYVGDGCAAMFDPNDPQTVYGDNLFGVHYRSDSVSGGLSETGFMNFGITGSNSIAFHFVTTHHPTQSNHLYTANDNHIFRSITGTFWEKVADIANVRAIAISPILPSTVYAASYNGTAWNFYVSQDDGENWSTHNSPGWRVTDVEPDPITYGRVYATRNSINSGVAHVYISDDHGLSWISAGAGLPDVSANCITVNPYHPNLVYAGTDLGVYVSEDSGMTFTEYNDNLPPYVVMDMHFHKLDSTLRIATLGRGVWKTKSFLSGPSTGIADELFSGLKVKVNPFRDQTSVQFSLARASQVEYYIVNPSGQRIASLFEGTLTAGSHELRWDGTNALGHRVASGMYYGILSSQGRKQSVKLVKE